MPWPTGPEVPLPFVASFDCAALPGWMSDDEDNLSAFQQRVARDLPHREQLCAVVDRLWPEGNSATVQFGGYTWGIGAMATDHLYETPELTMAEQNVRTDDELLLEEAHKITQQLKEPGR